MKTPSALLVIAAAFSLSGCIGLTLTPEERPLSAAVNDFNARAQLNGALLAESPSLFTNVATSVIEGRVHLSGSVRTAEDRRKAARIAWATPHVVEVVNNIEVTQEDTGFGGVARDRMISAAVRARLITDSAIRDVNYTIDTQNGVVYVLGIAQNQNELERVLAHARATAEVKRVVNYAVLRDDPRRFVQRPGQTVDEAETEQGAP